LWGEIVPPTNKQFCLSHISCLSAILFCTRGSTFAEKIANRIISDYSKSLISSLSSSNTSTVHSTLGLLIALSRVSSGIAKNVYSNIVKSCSILNQLLQKGKSYWRCLSCGSENNQIDSEYCKDCRRDKFGTTFTIENKNIVLSKLEVIKSALNSI
jgi:hypothetical protein